MPRTRIFPTLGWTRGTSKTFRERPMHRMIIKMGGDDARYRSRDIKEDYMAISKGCSILVPRSITWKSFPPLLPPSVTARSTADHYVQTPRTMAGTDTQPAPKRTPRACERCRQTRRRCGPPYPCRQCVQAGVACDVREKARPHRRQRQPCPGTRQAATIGLKDKRQALARPPERQIVQRDTFEIFRGLVEDLLLDKQGQ